MERSTRRHFIELGAAGALVAAGVAGSLGRASAAPSRATAPTTDDFVERDIVALQRMMKRRQISSVELTQGYLDRIAALNPLLGAVIETNPDALAIARKRDRDRGNDEARGPLHGIPVLLKDNIATADRMETTAGSLALVGSKVPADADLVANLRRAGAVVLGKANLSEWANFRGFAPFNGWTARGGFTRNPYRLDLDPSGSSSGSAAAAAASLSAVTVGSETDGSILSPSGEQSVVGIKPTLGLISGSGIIPIAHSQDTAGPMARTVRDAALLLDVLRKPGRTVMGRRVPESYTEFLRGAEGLRGMRIALDRLFIEGIDGPGIDEVVTRVDEAADALRRAGAVVVDGHIVASAVVHLTGSNRHIQFCAGIRARQLARLLLP